MKALVCEMCNSNDVVKQDGVFICQNCGTKYSVEEAKKMMIEMSGSVDVSGSTIKVDNSSFVQRSLENARRAKAKEDWEECEKYYNMVEQYEPTNIEAIFYSSYGKARMSLVEADRYKRAQKFNVLKNSISVIDDNYDNSPEKYEENKGLILQIDRDLYSLFNSNFVYNQRTQNDITTDDRNVTYVLLIELSQAWIESVNNIISVITEEKNKIYLYYIIRGQCNYIYMNPYVPKTWLQWYFNKIKETDSIIEKLDPSYQPVPPPSVKKRARSGCYIATCVYGSYDCPQVWTLRRFRDFTLAKTWYGKTFIKLYYTISPTLVKLFGNTKWFKKLWKGGLDRLIKSLKEKGFKDTAYYDR